MEQFDKNSDEALNELLRKYLLEEGERDRLANEALEMHADFVFSEAPLVLPPTAKEQELINQLHKKVAAGSGAPKYWRVLWAAPVLALLIVGLWFGLNHKSSNPTITVNNTLPTPPTVDTATTPIVAITDSKPTPTIAATTTPKHRHKKPDTIGQITVVPDVKNSNSITTNTVVPVIANTKPQADFKNLTKQLLKKSNQYITQLPSERLYAHTDREVYQPGQDIWYAVYLRNEYDLHPSEISDVVNVQLTGPDGKEVAIQQLIVKDGVAQGDMQLAYGLPEGIYHFKAYTKWQQNNPTDFQFEKDIVINEPDITFNDDSVRTKLLKSAYPPITSGAGTEAAAGLRLEFYPEGGEMVAGHEGRVAFQVVDKNNEPVAVEGYVTDQNGKHVSNFKTSYRGMGMFALQPEIGVNYTAYLTKPAGIKKNFTLPKTVENGLAFSVERMEREFVSIKIHSPSNTKSLMIAQVRGQIVYTHQYDLKQGDNTVAIPTKFFPAGVAQFTLFDAYGEPTAERLAFVNRHKLLNLQLLTDKAQYSPREKVQMKIKVTDDKGQPVQGYFSLSVHDAQPLATEISGQGNIISKLMLEADLGGHADDAGAYFDTRDAQSASHLDLLLMTRGWRKFLWKQLLTNSPPALKYANEKSLLKGVVVDATGQPMKGIRIEVKGSNVKMLTNSEGKFEIHKLDLSEPKEMTLSYKSGLMTYVLNRYDENMSITFYADNRKVYTNAVNDAVHPVISGTQKTPKDSSVIVGQVMDVYGDGITKATVTAQSTDKKSYSTTTDVNGFYTIIIPQAGEYMLEATATGYQHKTMKATIKQGNSLITDVQLLPEKQLMSEVRIAEERARINVKDPNLRFAFLSPDIRLIAAGDKNTILENTNEQDKEDLAKLYSATPADPGDITFYFGGLRLHPNEAVPISTSRLLSIKLQMEGVPAKFESHSPISNYGYSNEEIAPRVSDKNTPDNFKAKYYKAREFPTVKYKATDRVTKPKDFRSTIYWNGAVQTDIEGKAVVEFYNSDDITTFAADMEGISDKGMPGIGNTTFSTKLPFKVYADIPMITDQTKHVEVPVYFSNTSGYLLNGKLEYRFPEVVHATGPLVKDYTIFPLAKDTLSLGLDIQQGKAPGKLEIIFTTNGYRYVLSKYIGIVKAKPEN